MKSSDILAMIRGACQPGAVDSVADWCCANLVFDEASYHGPFHLNGSEYWRDVLEDFRRADVSDSVIVAGSQTHKTGTVMGGVAWCTVHDPCGILWVLPTIPLARRVSRQRFRRLLRASHATRALIPADRHLFSTLEISIGASVVNFVGSNSAANLSSSPCRRVILDEVDKFPSGTRFESDAVNLAEQRTKDAPSPQRWKLSTPTHDEGLIWREFLKGDQRRYFIPCPGCGKDLLLAWSKQYTTFTLRGCEAFIRWPPECRRPDGSWDVEAVARETYAVCPYCSRQITEANKPAMVRAGHWIATGTASQAGFISRHLSSLYSCSPEVKWGTLAAKFLAAKNTIEGVRGFIQGDLAEPYIAQDLSRERHERIVERIELRKGEECILTVDCQARAPFFFCVVRVWNRTSTRGIAAVSMQTWEEVEALQKQYNVASECVFVDSGWAAKADAEVYGECARRCRRVASHGVTVLWGWMPCKGQPGHRTWPHKKKKVSLPFTTRDVDPFEGTSTAGRAKLDLLLFSTDTFKDWLDLLRAGKGGMEWSVEKQVATEEYWRHMDCERRTVDRVRNTGVTKWTWHKRHHTWPNHFFDCEVLQVAAASFLGVLNYNQSVRKASL